MRTSWWSPRVVGGILLLLALVGVLAWLGLPLTPVQQPAALTLAEGSAADSPLPPAPVEPVAPTEEIIVITPPPEGEVIILPPVTPGQIYAFPSPTLFPIPTPMPTPTRLPGLEVKPYPTRTLAPSAEGQLLIRSEAAKGWQALPVDAKGQAAGELQTPPFPQDEEVYSPSLSPDGKYWALLLPSEPGGRPYVYNNETQEVKPLLPERPTLSGYFFGWHPNGRQVLFWAGNSAVWLMDVESGKAIPLAVFSGPMQGATMSPDGQYVVYIADSDTAFESIWMVSQAGSDAQVLTDIDGGGYIFGWSPDGKYILMMGTPKLGDGEEAAALLQKSRGLWLFNPQEKSFLPIAAPHLGGYALEPAWSPDGKWIVSTGPANLDSEESLIDDDICRKDRVFSQECLFQNANIYIENIETGELRHIGRGAYPAWSPDGVKLAYVAHEDGKSVVKVVDVANPTDGGLPLTIIDGFIYDLMWTSK